MFPAEPHILNLSVVETPCGSDSAPWRLQCEAEGNPLPKIVWLLPSRYMLENKDETSKSSPYHVTSCVPYLEEEEEELTCRAESALTHTERTYPTREPQYPVKIQSNPDYIKYPGPTPNESQIIQGFIVF